MIQFVQISMANSPYVSIATISGPQCSGCEFCWAMLEIPVKRHTSLIEITHLRSSLFQQFLSNLMLCDITMQSNPSRTIFLFIFFYKVLRPAAISSLHLSPEFYFFKEFYIHRRNCFYVMQGFVFFWVYCYQDCVLKFCVLRRGSCLLSIA